MGYSYRHTPVPVTEKITQLCRENNMVINVENAKRAAEENLNVFADLDYSTYPPKLELYSRVRTLEHEGIDNLVNELKETVFAYADAGVYTVTDEHNETRTVTVQ